MGGESRKAKGGEGLNMLSPGEVEGASEVRERGTAQSGPTRRCNPGRPGDRPGDVNRPARRCSPAGPETRRSHSLRPRRWPRGAKARGARAGRRTATACGACACRTCAATRRTTSSSAPPPPPPPPSPPPSHPPAPPSGGPGRRYAGGEGGGGGFRVCGGSGPARRAAGAWQTPSAAAGPSRLSRARPGDLKLRRRSVLGDSDAERWPARGPGAAVGSQGLGCLAGDS
jgi:hypothetical protein